MRFDLSAGRPALADLLVSDGSSALIVGPICSGKTTMLSEIVSLLTDRGRHVFALEQVPELHQTHARNGRFTAVSSLVDVHREKPFAVVVDELRTHEEIRQTLAFARAGAQIIAVTHGVTIVSSVSRLGMLAGGVAGRENVTDAFPLCVHLGRVQAAGRETLGIKQISRYVDGGSSQLLFHHAA